MYPNPVSNILRIDTNRGVNRLTIFDILGVKVDVIKIETANYPIEIDVNNYPKSFLVKVIGDDYVTVRKIIKE